MTLFKNWIVFRNWNAYHIPARNWKRKNCDSCCRESATIILRSFHTNNPTECQICSLNREISLTMLKTATHATRATIFTQGLMKELPSATSFPRILLLLGSILIFLCQLTKGADEISDADRPSELLPPFFFFLCAGKQCWAKSLSPSLSWLFSAESLKILQRGGWMTVTWEFFFILFPTANLFESAGWQLTEGLTNISMTAFSECSSHYLRSCLCPPND